VDFNVKSGNVRWEIFDVLSFLSADSNGILKHETLSYDEFYQNGPKMTKMFREFLMPHKSPKVKPIAMYQYHKRHFLDS